MEPLKLENGLERRLANEMGGLERIALRYTGDPVDAEDLVQDTLVLALRFQNAFREGTNVRAWLARIMRNRHISLVRRRKLERRVAETEGRFALTDWSVGEMGRRGMKRDGGIQVGSGFSDPVFEAIDGLCPEFKEVVMMCDVEGLSYAEAAERTDRPLGTIMSRLHRGRRHLRRKLVSREQLEAA